MRRAAGVSSNHAISGRRGAPDYDELSISEDFGLCLAYFSVLIDCMDERNADVRNIVYCQHRWQYAALENPRQRGVGKQLQRCAGPVLSIRCPSAPSILQSPIYRTFGVPDLHFR